MAGIFDAIPAITVTLFVIGLVGVMFYEKLQSKSIEEADTWILILYLVILDLLISQRYRKKHPLQYYRKKIVW